MPVHSNSPKDPLSGYDKEFLESNLIKHESVLSHPTRYGVIVLNQDQPTINRIENLKFKNGFIRYLENQSGLHGAAIYNAILHFYLIKANITPYDRGLLRIHSDGYLFQVRWSKLSKTLTIETLQILHKVGKVAAEVIFKGDYKTIEEMLSEVEGENAATAAFKRQTQKALSVPEDGIPKFYPGKRSAGDVREFLANAYPYREGAEPLTLKWLESHDRKAWRALYTQSTSESGAPSSFLTDQTAESDQFLSLHSLDLTTPEGLAVAQRVYGLLHGRLFPKKRKM